MSDTDPDDASFCIGCGAPDPVVEGHCGACIQEMVDGLKAPDRPVEIQRCAHCGTFTAGQDLGSPENVAEAVEQAAVGSLLIAQEVENVEIAVRTRRRDPQSFTVAVQLEGSYGGQVAIEDEATVDVDVETISCEACSRRHGGYYEAIVQVRYEGDEEVSEEQAGEIAEIIEEEVRHAGGLSGGQAYLLKATPKHGGYDYYFGAKPVAKSVATRLADRYGGQKTHSTTLAGRRDGEDFHRLTIVVRIPRVRPGSVVGFEDEVVRIHSRQGNRLIGKTVPEGKGRTIEQRNADRARILEPEVVDVVYAEGGEGQILDPRTLDAVQVRLPRDVEAGDELEAVRFRDRWVVLGPPGWE